MWRLQEHRVRGHSLHKPEIVIGSFPENRERVREKERWKNIQVIVHCMNMESIWKNSWCKA